MSFNGNGMTPESALLLEVIRGHRPFCFENIDFKKFGRLVNFHEIEPLIFIELKDHANDIPRDIYEDLKSHYWITLYGNKRFWNAFLRINEAFRQKNVPLLPLKGVDTLVRSYPVADLRNMADVDLLIREEDFEEAEKILFALGYRKDLEGLLQEYWQKHQCHIVFLNDKIRVEVHWGLDFKRNHRVILPHLWERVRQIDIGNNKISAFSPEDALFSFALHWRRFGNIFTLKQVIDVAHLIKGPPGIDWDYILKESGSGRMKATVYFILMQAYLFCEIKIPKGVFEKLNIPFWQKILMKKFLLKHTCKPTSLLKITYLKSHFLLYDNILEAVLYLINIPYEQFCKFYGFKPYTKKADLRYRLRIPYMALSLLKMILSRGHSSQIHHEHI